MAPAPHVIYSEELSKALGRGHPIANPQPVVYETTDLNGEVTQSEPKLIQIGDVGYIQPEQGFFVSLFNVHLEPGVGGQPGIDDLPHGFQVLQRDSITRTQDSTPVFVSHSVKTINIDAEASGPFYGGFAGFKASSNRGAILATPDPIESHNALHIIRYKRYTIENIESWHEFAVRRDHDVSVEDLMLVTGVDRTTSWATAVFNNTELEAGFGLKVQFAEVAGAYSSPVDTPGKARSAPFVSNAAMQIEPERQPINVANDQAVFIRHIRVMPRRLWRGLKIKAEGEQDDSDPDDSDTIHDDSTDNLMVNIVAKGRSAPRTGRTVATLPKRRQFRDCLEPVLHYILEHSDAKFAIAHDDDVESLSQEAVKHVMVQDGFGFVDGPGHPDSVGSAAGGRSSQVIDGPARAMSQSPDASPGNVENKDKELSHLATRPRVQGALIPISSSEPGYVPSPEPSYDLSPRARRKKRPADGR